MDEALGSSGNLTFVKLEGKEKSCRDAGSWISSSGRDLDRMEGKAKDINAVGIKAPS